MRPVFVNMENIGFMSVRRGTPRAFSLAGAGRLFQEQRALPFVYRQIADVLRR